MVLSCMTNYDGFVKVKGKMNYAIAIGIRTALERNAGAQRLQKPKPSHAHVLKLEYYFALKQTKIWKFLCFY